ncbi:unnamed protein product, partial [Notodromas monacha]
MNKYAPDNELYPTDPQKRARVDDLLFFDACVLYDRFGQYVYPAAFGGESLNEEKKQKLDDGLGFLDHYIKQNGGYVAGDKLTVADLSCVASVSSMKATGVVDLSKFENITAWLAKCESEVVAYEEANGEGAKSFGG